MYNRYIPQPDGSYRRNRIPDPAAKRPVRPAPPPPPREPKEMPPVCEPAPKPQQKHSNSQIDSSITGFLKQLLPNDFDISDLLIVLLVLLMAGNCEEDQNTALLTLALYLFM